LTLSLQLELFEKNALRAALRRAGGNVVLAAEQLGIGKTTLYDKLKRFEIST
jgi:two-component system, NtrC family, C4-dicarboxylate transport response regulator DctD